MAATLPPRYRFGELLLSPGRRLLLRNGEPVALPPRYLDLLLFLLAERHRVVGREEIHQRVWGGVAVTDGAFTQAVRTLRRALGDDDPRAPRFLRTAARHGYQFVAPGVVEEDDAAPLPGAVEFAPAALPVAGSEPPATPAAAVLWPRAALRGLAGGALGAAIAGVVLALLLGSALVLAAGIHWRLLAVLCAIAAVVGAWGGGAVGAGIAAGTVAPLRGMTSVLLGAAAGGAAGALGHLLVGWTMSELLGHRVTALGGAFEGAVLGGAVALGVVLTTGGGTSDPRPASTPLAAALAGALAAGVLAAAGARLSASSLDAIGDALKGARLMVPLGVLLGERGGGPATRLAVSLLEGGFFGAGVAAGLRWVLSGPASRTVVAPRSG